MNCLLEAELSMARRRILCIANFFQMGRILFSPRARWAGRGAASLLLLVLHYSATSTMVPGTGVYNISTS